MLKLNDADCHGNGGQLAGAMPTLSAGGSILDESLTRMLDESKLTKAIFQE